MPSDQMLVMDLLDKTGTPYQHRECYSKDTKRQYPNAAFEIEIENTNNYGNDCATSVWLFNASGELLRVGHFSN